MSNPYMLRTLREEDARRPKKSPAPQTPVAEPAPAKKAAESAAQSDNPPIKEN